MRSNLAWSPSARAIPQPPLASSLARWLRASESDSAVTWHTSGQMARALRCERARASRTGEAFSLLVFRWLDADDQRAGQRALRFLLHRRLRETDQVGWLSNGEVGVVLPFANASAVRAIVDGLIASYPTTRARLACDIYHSQAFPGSPTTGRLGKGPSRLDSSHYPPAGGAPPGSKEQGARLGSASFLPADGAPSVSFQSMQVLFTKPIGPWKRALDIVGGLLGLVLFAPVLLLAMLLICIVSPGPALFRQQRAGRGGVPFTIYKLRTMCPDAEALKPALLAANELDGPAFKMTRDPRLIPVVGRALRSSSVDELPQFWNVLIGDMSLVGATPAAPQ